MRKEQEQGGGVKSRDEEKEQEARGGEGDREKE